MFILFLFIIDFAFILFAQLLFFFFLIHCSCSFCSYFTYSRYCIIAFLFLLLFYLFLFSFLVLFPLAHVPFLVLAMILIFTSRPCLFCSFAYSYICFCSILLLMSSYCPRSFRSCCSPFLFVLVLFVFIIAIGLFVLVLHLFVLVLSVLYSLFLFFPCCDLSWYICAAVKFMSHIYVCLLSILMLHESFMLLCNCFQHSLLFLLQLELPTPIEPPQSPVIEPDSSSSSRGSTPEVQRRKSNSSTIYRHSLNSNAPADAYKPITAPRSAPPPIPARTPSSDGIPSMPQKQNSGKHTRRYCL